MAWYNINSSNSNKITDSVVDYSPYVMEQAPVVGGQVNPNFKGEVENKNIKFPVELGIQHPFDFKITEGLYRTYGMVTAVVDKYVDFIVGPGFFVTSTEGDKGDKAVQVINDFLRDINFDTLLREWLREGLLKGNGFLEIGGKEDESPKGMKLLNANYMYVDRDDKGVVEGYNQFTGAFKEFDMKQVEPFEPFQIAHLPLCRVGDDAYGLGIISPGLKFLDDLIKNQKDLHMLMGRKANAPLQIKLGGVVGGKYFKPNPTDVQKYGKDLEWLTNKHEWATDGLTEMKVVDFGNIGEKFNEVLNHDLEMLMITFQIPEVILGKAVNLATAPVQMDAFERKIKSIQAQTEKVIENDIFKRVLLANKLDVHVEFNWGKLSTLEKDNRITKITALLSSQHTSMALRKLAEKEVVNLMEFDEAEFEFLSEEEERLREEERSQALVPGQNASPPAPVRQLRKIDVKEDINNYTLKEWLGFNYNDYLEEIDNFIDSYKFEFLIAANSVELQAGLLSEVQIESLRGVMKEGFKEELSLKEISVQIDNKVNPGDLFKIEDGKLALKDNKPILVKGKEHRGIGIARTETTKVANEGAKLQFKEGGVTHIRWVASFGKRTCPTCEALNGQVFPIDDHPNIPIHGMCRCTLVPVVQG